MSGASGAVPKICITHVVRAAVHCPLSGGGFTDDFKRGVEGGVGGALRKSSASEAEVVDVHAVELDRSAGVVVGNGANVRIGVLDVDVCAGPRNAVYPVGADGPVPTKGVAPVAVGKTKAGIARQGKREDGL